MKNVIITINGRVQGVGFRYHTRQTALEYNISGFIKNMVDGSVYIEASGSKEEIEQFINWCNNGPKWAFVESIEVIEGSGKVFKEFKIH